MEEEQKPFEPTSDWAKYLVKAITELDSIVTDAKSLITRATTVKKEIEDLLKPGEQNDDAS